MTKLDHQANELVEAFSNLINTENTKARLDVFSIIKDGHDAQLDPVDILKNLLDWVKGDKK
jgi:hypothetical protein